MPVIRLIFVILITIFYAFKEIFIHLFHLKVDNRVYVNWSKALNRIISIKLEVSGLENIQKGQSYIYVCNHSSLLDIPVLFGALPGDVRIIYKQELEKIPIFGYALRKSNLIGIERKDPRKSMSSLEEAIATIRDGASVIIFPEGTRESGREVGPFKRGGFLIAEKALVPIAPIAVEGTYDLLPAGKFILKPGKVRISILEPIETKSLEISELKALKELVREKIITEMERK
jgi:1-acyl-sn-glycerol-3-phosphate acyltransferase